MSEQLIPTPSVFGETGNFLLERELGRGGMGGVYMGRDKMLDRPVAVKVMLKEFGADPEFVEKFKKEAQASAKLIHPNIAQVYSYGIADGMPYMAMELVAGGSLDQVMSNQKGTADIQRILKIGEQVAQALRCASDMGFVHGDVKPENILLDSNGNAKLVDFGLAAMQKDTDEIWGTPYYIAPEKVRKDPVDFRADMYNLGGTLYHALTGVAPFEGTDSNEVVKKRFEVEPRRPSEIRPEITPSVDDLVMKMLAFEPADRFPSFEALLEEFKFVLSNGLVKKPTPAPGHGGKKLVIKGKKKFKVKSPSQEPQEKVRHSYDTEEEEESGSGLVGKVLLVIGGVIALIGIVIGLLFWFKSSTARAERDEYNAQVAGKLKEAHAAIDTTRSQVTKFAGEIEEWKRNAINNAETHTARLAKQMPGEEARRLKPAPTKELLDAIALTNAPAKVEADEKDVKAAANEAASEESAEEKVPAKRVHKYKKFRDPTEEEQDAMSPEGRLYREKKKEWDARQREMIANGELDEDELKELEAEKAASGKGDDEDEETPKKVGSKVPADDDDGETEAEAPASSGDFSATIKDMNALWETVYAGEAAAIRVCHELTKLIERIDGDLEAHQGADEETVNALAELSRNATEKYNEIHDSKDATTVRSTPGKIDKRGNNIVRRTEKEINERQLQAARDKQAKENAAAEKARLEAIANEKAETIERETKAARQKFDSLAVAGTFRLLDWGSAIRQLQVMSDEFKYAESQLVAENAMLKVRMMKSVHDILIQNAVGFTFQRSKLHGAEVKETNEDELKIQKPGQKPSKITWVKFYQQYHGNLNELIQKYVEKGRGNAKLDGGTLTLRNWAEAMMGAALTMRIICSDDAMAIPRGEQIAKKAVAEFPDYLKYAQQIFPDIAFDGVAQEDEENE